MSGYPKDYPNGPQIQLGIIAGGDITDPPSDQSCNQKIYSPIEHSPDGVKLEHLAFSPMHHSPTNHSQQAFQGALDPGSLVYVMKVTGQNQVMMIGQANDFNNAERNRSGGNLDLMNNPIVKELLNRTIKIWIPPQIQEKEIKGAKVKVPKEKGTEHCHNLLKGIPTHGAMFQMSGYRLPQIKQAPTALQHYSNLLTNDDMGSLAGGIMSLGSMFQGLLGGIMGGGGGGGSGGGGGGGQGQGQGGGGGGQPQGNNIGQVYNSETGINFHGSVNAYSIPSTTELIASNGLNPDPNSHIPMNRILSRIEDPRLQDAVVSLAILTQGLDAGGSLGSYVTGNRAHMPTVLENAEDLFSQVTSFGDIMEVMQLMVSDYSLYGQDKLTPVTTTIDTADGTAQKTVFPDGIIRVVNDGTQQNVDNTFSNNVTSGTQNYGSGNQGGGGGGGDGGGDAPSGSGQNMFGDMGKNLMDMLKRVSPQAEKKQKQCINDCNTSQQGKKIQRHVNALIKAKNPIDPQLFD